MKRYKEDEKTCVPTFPPAPHSDLDSDGSTWIGEGNGFVACNRVRLQAFSVPHRIPTTEPSQVCRVKSVPYLVPDAFLSVHRCAC